MEKEENVKEEKRVFSNLGMFAFLRKILENDYLFWRRYVALAPKYRRESFGGFYPDKTTSDLKNAWN